MTLNVLSLFLQKWHCGIFDFLMTAFGKMSHLLWCCDYSEKLGISVQKHLGNYSVIVKTLHTMCYIRGRSLCRICCMAPMVSVLSSLVCRLHFQVLQLLDGISLMTRLCITIFSPYRIPGYSIAFTPVNGCDLGYNCATTSSQPLYFSLGFLWKYSVLKESATINNRKTKCLA